MSDRILIVSADAKPLARHLRDAGYDVETASHAFDGLEKIAAFAPHLVIAELAVRGMDGVRFCECALASEGVPAVIAIAETNVPRRAVATLRAGVRAYLTKPVDFELLQLVVAHALADRVTRIGVEQLSTCIHDLETSVDRPMPPPPPPPVGMPRVPGATLAELARYAILSTLQATGGSTSKTARMLGLSTRTIQYRMHLYDARLSRSVGQRPEERH